MYIICFKNGTKMRVSEENAEIIFNEVVLEGNLFFRQEKVTINLSEILYIQPEELEIKTDYNIVMKNTRKKIEVIASDIPI